MAFARLAFPFGCDIIDTMSQENPMSLWRVLAVLVTVMMGAPAAAQDGSVLLAQFGGGDLICRVSPEGARYTGGNRDCNARRVGPDGSCSCPSSYGPIPGVVVGQYGGRGGYGGRGYRPRMVTVCRISPEASRYTGGNRDCGPQYSDGRSCACPSSRGMIPGQLVRAPEF